MDLPDNAAVALVSHADVADRPRLRQVSRVFRWAVRSLNTRLKLNIDSYVDFLGTGEDWHSVHTLTLQGPGLATLRFPATFAGNVRHLVCEPSVAEEFQEITPDQMATLHAALFATFRGLESVDMTPLYNFQARADEELQPYYHTRVVAKYVPGERHIDEYAALSGLGLGLKTLDLSGWVCRSDFRFLTRLENLTHLDVSHTRFDGECLEGGRLSRLLSLDVSHCSRIRVAGWSAIADLGRLERLVMRRLDLFDSFAGSLSRLTGLTELRVDHCMVYHDSAAALHRLTCLTSIDTIHVSPGEPLHTYEGFEHLVQFEMNDCGVWENDMYVAWARNPVIRRMTLQNCRLLTDAGVAELMASRSRSLTRLVLVGCPMLTFPCIRDLKDLKDPKVVVL